MITAPDARQLVKTNMDDKMEFISDLISEAAKRGEHSVIIKEPPVEGWIDYVTRHGFKVNMVSFASWKISWEEEC